VTSAHPPTVTVAIPLHRSAPWVPNIIANVRSLPPTVTEIIVSDRTMKDDAARRLRRRLADDPRVRIITEASDLHWTEHFQTLIDEAKGELFMWMPHDDVFEATWVPMLVDTLAAHPDAWLAFGRLEPVEVDGVTPRPGWRPRPRRPGPISGWSAVRMMSQGEMGIPFRGLVRRRRVLDAGITVHEANGSPLADIRWVFNVSLRAPIVFDDRTSTRKRFHQDNTFIRWRRGPGDLQQCALDVLVHNGPGGVRGAAMRTFLRFDERRARRRWTGNPLFQ
jgi:hypothetical protein